MEVSCQLASGTRFQSFMHKEKIADETRIMLERIVVFFRLLYDCQGLEELIFSKGSFPILYMEERILVLALFLKAEYFRQLLKPVT